MLLKELLSDIMQKRHLSIKQISALTEIKETKMSLYLDGAVPSDKDYKKICVNLHIDENDITYDELSMSVNECATLLNRSAIFVRHAIEQKQLPGMCIKEGKNRTFHIPRIQIYTYLGMTSNSHLMAASLAIVNEIKKSLPTTNDEATTYK